MRKTDKINITIEEPRLRSYIRKRLINEAAEQDVDKAYKQAIRNGAMKRVRAMVCQAFKQAFPNTKVVDYDGNPKVVYHGTSNGKFNVFDKERIGEKWNADEAGFFFIDNIGIGREYMEPYPETRKADRHLFSVFLNITNPLVIDSKWFRKAYGLNIMGFDAIYVWDNHQSDILDAARQGNHDGIIIDTKGMGMPQPMMYVAFEPNQIKSAEAIERDDQGNIIPLSKRFTNSDDMRYEEE